MLQLLTFFLKIGRWKNVQKYTNILVGHRHELLDFNLLLFRLLLIRP
jgi:hypothetical protein